MRFTILTTLLFASFLYAQAQSNSAVSNADIDQLKKEILSLQGDVENIKLNLGKSERHFKTGIAVATIGYSVTIAGGLMLGRKRDELGKGLLVAGGITGITGTILMVDAFKFLGRASRTRSSSIKP